MSPTCSLSSLASPGRAKAWLAKAQEQKLVPRPRWDILPLAAQPLCQQLSQNWALLSHSEHCWGQHSKGIINFRNQVFCVPYTVLTIITLHFYCIFTPSQFHSSPVMFVVSAGCRTAAGDAVFFTSAHQAYHKWFPSLINCMSKQNLFNNAFPFSGSSLQSREMSWQNMQ